MQDAGLNPAFIKFQFHKGTIKPNANKQQQFEITVFQFHKGTIKPLSLLILPLFNIDFNSIKVQLSPIALGYIISLFPIGFAGAKLRNLIEKMSMGNYVFLGVLRQPLYLFVLQ